jgi:hypothetical protein
MRQHHRKKSGAVVDTLWYGMLLSEWKNASESKDTDQKKGQDHQ